MNTRASAAVLTFVLAGMAVVPSLVQAQAPRSGGSANAELMQQMQQLASERTSLQADNARLKQQVAELTKQSDALKNSELTAQQHSRTSAAALEQSNSKRAASEQELEQTKLKMQELINKFKEVILTLRSAEAERAQLQQELAKSKAAYDHCALDNDGLYQVNSEVLNRYSHQGTFSCLGRDEPFTGLTRARVDNLSMEYRQRADELRVQKKPGGSAAPGSSTATPLAPAAQPAPIAPPGPAAAAGSTATTSPAPDAQATPASKP